MARYATIIGTGMYIPENEITTTTFASWMGEVSPKLADVVGKFEASSGIRTRATVFVFRQICLPLLLPAHGVHCGFQPGGYSVPGLLSLAINFPHRLLYALASSTDATYSSRRAALPRIGSD